MVIISTTLHTGRDRPWAYEIPMTCVGDDGREHNVVMVFRDGVPDRAAADAMTAFHVARIEAEEVEVEIEPEL